MSDLDGLARDLGRAPAVTAAQALAVMRLAGQRAQSEWRTIGEAYASRRLRHLPASVTHSVAVTPTGIEAEVGYDRRKRQGSLGHIAEWGTSRHGPVMPMQEAVARQAEQWLPGRIASLGVVL